MTFPSKIEIKKIDAKASTYCKFAVAYTTFAHLYEGGALLQEAVIKLSLYLLQKPKEVAEVFKTRQERFIYTNLLGNIIGWYGAALFKTPAQIVKKLASATQMQPVVKAPPAPVAPPPPTPKPGEPTPPPPPAKAPPLAVAAVTPPELPKEAQDFCTAFEKDADHAGTAYVDFWRKVWETIALNKAAYVLIDLPAPDAGVPAPINFAQQQEAGLLNPYLVLYKPSQVINWETDDYGNLTWCIIAVTVEERVPFEKPVIADYWYYFDTEEVGCYKSVRKDDQVTSERSDQDMAVLVDGYPRKHAMSNLHRIPIRKIEVLDGLWLGNRVYLPLLNHLNLDNAFDFALFQSALAQLVIKGKFDDSVTMSEVAYLKLGKDDDAFYLEPEGKAYDAIATRLDGLEERIYKACYLMDQARTNRSTPSAQSGISKQQDKTPSRDALSAYGDVIRPAMQMVYTDVLAIRELTDIVPDIRGFDFADKAGVEDMDLLEKSTIIDIQSDTFRRERDMLMTRLAMPNLNPETQTLIDAEIQANPTPEAAAQAQQEAQSATQLQTLSTTFKNSEGIGA
jgi:hypothetical protein